MLQTWILYPVFVQVGLTFAVLIMMGAARQTSMRARGKTIDDMALASDADWDTSARKRSNNFKNQFELPVLFYAVTAFALATRNVDVAMLALAWIFALTRIAHTYVHVTSNRVAWRGSAYIIGMVALLAMWVLLAIRIMIGF